MTETSVAYEWRERFDNAQLNALHAEAFDHRLLEDHRWDRFIATASAGAAETEGRGCGGLLGKRQR